MKEYSITYFQFINRNKNGSCNKDGKYIVSGLIECDNGIAYFKNGKLHREDGPATEWFSTQKRSWLINGKYHRLDGPAIMTPDYKSYYIDGRRFSSKEHFESSVEYYLYKNNLQNYL